MVGKGCFPVYFAGDGLPVGRAHDIVDSDVERAFVVRDALPVGGSDVAVGEPSGYGMAGVGDGTVVEVAAEDDAPVAGKAVDVLGNGFDLSRTDNSGIGNLLDEEA